MYDSDGNLYEGLSSNFYIYYNDTIYIAPEDAVLEGTIGKMVFKGCKEMNIPVRREFPKIKDIKKWAGAFITSKILYYNIYISIIKKKKKKKKYIYIYIYTYIKILVFWLI